MTEVAGGSATPSEEIMRGATDLFLDGLRAAQSVRLLANALSIADGSSPYGSSQVLAPVFGAYSASNSSARSCRPAGGAVYYGPGPQPQAAESAPIGANSYSGADGRV